MQHPYYDQIPVEKLILDYTDKDIHSETLDALLKDLAVRYKKSYDNLDRSWFKYKASSLKSHYEYLISRLIRFYAVDESLIAVKKAKFWMIVNQSFSGPRKVKRPSSLDKSIEEMMREPKPSLKIRKPKPTSSSGNKVGKRPKVIKSVPVNLDSLSSFNKIPDVKREVVLYKNNNPSVLIECYATYEEKQLTIEFAKLAGSYEDEYYMIIDFPALFLVYDRLGVKRNDVSALLSKMSSTFVGKDCFYEIESFLKQNDIGFSYLIRR